MMKEKAPKNPDKIGLGEKLCFTLTQMGCTPALSLITSFLTLYYITICKMDPTAVGTLFLISKLFDGINDPLTGFIMDRTPNTKMGKFRTMMIVGSFICAINMLFVWYGPYWAPVGKYVIAYISYLLMGITYDIMDISKNSILTVMTRDPGERASLSVFGSFGSLLGTMLISIAAPIIIASLGGEFHAYFVLILVAFIYIVVLMTGGALGVKERVRAVNEEEEKHSVKEMFSVLLEKPCLIITIVGIVYALGQYVSIGFDTYYFTYVLGDLSLMSTVSMVTLLTMLLGVVIAKPVSVKIGRKATIALSFVFMIVGLLIKFFFRTEIWAAYLGSAILRFGIGFEMPPMTVMGSENKDYVEYKRGFRADSIMTSISTFFSKVGAAIGGALPAYILAWAGFSAENAVVTDTLKNSICAWGFLFPIALFAIGAVIVYFFYHLDYDEVKNGLEKRMKEHSASQDA